MFLNDSLGITYTPNSLDMKLKEKASEFIHASHSYIDEKVPIIF